MYVFNNNNCISLDLKDLAKDNRGQEFWLAIPPNNIIVRGEIVYPPQVLITTDENSPVPFTVRSGRTGTPVTYVAIKGEVTQVLINDRFKINPNNLLAQGNDLAINVRSSDGRNLIVYGFIEETASIDGFLALPKFETTTGSYEYIAVSVPDGPPSFRFRGFITVVVNEDMTRLSITPSTDVNTFFGIKTFISAGETAVLRARKTRAGDVYTFVATAGDLTGTRVIADKPITFLSGHQCGFVPSDKTACDHLVEQIPPIETWGFRFVLMPLTTREASGYKLIASKDSTTIQITCNRVHSEIILLNARQSVFRLYPNDYWCYVESNHPILVMLFSLGYTYDVDTTGSNRADPFMMMVPPIEQLDRQYNLLSPLESISDDSLRFDPYVNVFIPEEYFDAQVLLVNDVRAPVTFKDIINSAGLTVARAAQYRLSSNTSILQYGQNGDSRFGVLVYAWGRETSYGYPGGMKLDSVASMCIIYIYLPYIRTY